MGYELIKLAGRKDNLLTRIVSAPGMWLQHITTKEPDDEMIEMCHCGYEGGHSRRSGKGQLVMGRKDMTLRQGYEAIKKRLEAGCDSPPLTPPACSGYLWFRAGSPAGRGDRLLTAEEQTRLLDGAKQRAPVNRCNTYWDSGISWILPYGWGGGSDPSSGHGTAV